MYFVFSDVHGCLEEMNEMLKHWDKEKETLIVLGDLIDRGNNSYGVVKRLMELQNSYPDKVVVLKGNHEDKLLKWLSIPVFERAMYWYSDLNLTLKSFYQDNIKKWKKDTRKQRGCYVKKNFPEIVFWLRKLPTIYEGDSCIFVHAGLNFDNRDNSHHHLWIREEFYHSSHTSHKRIFFGHTPTSLIRGTQDNDENNDIWISTYGDKIAIDGGCVFGGQLNGLKIDNTGAIVEVIKVQAKDLTKTNLI